MGPVKEILSVAPIRPKKGGLHNTLRLFLSLLLPLLLLTYGLIAAIYFNQKGAEHERYKQVTIVQVKAVRDMLDLELNKVLVDVSLLAEYEELQHYLELQNEENRQHVNNAWDSFSKRKGIYDQVRFIDADGMEVVRVNYANGVASAVADAKLQPKKHRYYFTESYPLKRNEVYISAFDLNIEHKEVERPFKPMIRVATPVFDRQGSKRGVIVLNYLGARLLDVIKEQETSSSGRVMLLNDKGYYLKGLSKAAEWGFMFGEQGRMKTLVKDFPQAWSDISSKRSGHIDNEQGVFAFEHIEFPAANASVTSRFQRDWTLVYYVTRSELQTLFAPMRNTAWMIAGLMSGILVLVSWLLAGFQLQKRAAQEMLRSNEEHMRLILRSAAEGVLGVDPDGKTTFINAAALEMLGFSQDELIGECIHERIHHSHADGSPRPREECRIMTGLKAGSHQHVADDVFWRKSGSIFPVEYKVMPLLENGEIQGAVMTFSDITERRKMEQELQQRATIDRLTNIFNRQKFEEFLGQEIKQAHRYRGSLSLVMFDIDHFKQINDTYGHQVGDDVLKEIASIVQRGLREVDIFARWGGEEFMILATETNLDGAAQIAEKIRSSIAGHDFTGAGTVTVSLGIAQFLPDEEEKGLLKRTDDALYRAKESGRNRVERAG